MTTLVAGHRRQSVRQAPASGLWRPVLATLSAIVLTAVLAAWTLPPGVLVKSIVDLVFGPAGTAMTSRQHGIQSRPGTIIEPVSSEPLVQIPGLNIIVARVKFPPGAFSPKHNHPGSVFVYVLEGTIGSQLLGAPPGVYGPGQSFFEPPDCVHLFAENASPVLPAEILAVFIAPPGVPLISYLD